jgi:hypothetical protein
MPHDCAERFAASGLPSLLLGETDMDDNRLWSFEESLWTEGTEAIDAVADTPVWDSAELSERTVSRPQEGLIVIGYHVHAQRGDEAYEAHCTSVIRRLEHEVWRVVQHQQTPVLTKSVEQ